MEFRTVAGVKLPALGLGTWKMDHLEDVNAIKFAIEQGITHIDTAEMYGFGHTEELVAKAIEGFDRDKLFITTKVSPQHLMFNGVLTALKNSLARLKLDYIDLYLIHWPNPLVPMNKTIAALDEALKLGFTRHIGVSNFSLDLLKKAQSLTQSKILTDQVEYSLWHKNPEQSGLLEFCQEQGIFLTAYSPLAQGSGDLEENEVLNKLAEKYLKTPSQIALNYLIAQDNVITIPKSSNKEHIKENLGALNWKLDEQDLKLLKESKLKSSI